MYQFYRHLKAVLGSLYRDAVIVIQNHPGSFWTRFWFVTNQSSPKSRGSQRFPNVKVADHRLRRHESASKRHLKSLELLSKLRTIPLPVVAVENLTVVQAKAQEAEPDQAIVVGQKLHNRLEHAFEKCRVELIAN